MSNFNYKNMNKFRIDGVGLKIPCRKILLSMKLTLFLMCCFVFQLQAAVEAQNQTVSLKVENVSLAEAISQLKKQTKMDFFFSHSVVDVDQLVSLDLQNVSLKEALQRLLGKTYTYEFLDGIVIIKPFQQAQSEVQQQKTSLKGR